MGVFLLSWPLDSWDRLDHSPAAKGWAPRDYTPTHIPTPVLWGEGDTCVVINWSDLAPQLPEPEIHPGAQRGPLPDA